jgi:hypothetical protein
MSEALVTIYQTTWGHIPEKWNLHQHYCGKVKSCTPEKCLQEKQMILAYILGCYSTKHKVYSYNHKYKIQAGLLSENLEPYQNVLSSLKRKRWQAFNILPENPSDI